MCASLMEELARMEELVHSRQLPAFQHYDVLLYSYVLDQWQNACCELHNALTAYKLRHAWTLERYVCREGAFE